MTVAEYIVAYLRALGVSHLFGVSGANIEEVYDAAGRTPGITPVLAKHEFAAATMADGASRVGNRLGVVMSTSGGGAFNLVAGLAESLTSRVPILAIVGQIPTHLEGRGGFQDSSGQAGSIDAEALFAPTTRYCARIKSGADLPRALHDAVASALGEPAGPAVLLVPKDVQRMPIDPKDAYYMRLPNKAPFRPSLRYLLGLKRLRAALAPDRLRGSRIVIVAGAGVCRSDTREQLRRVAERLDAVVAVEPDAKDAFDNHSPRFLGVTGVMGHPPVARALRGARVCLLVGAPMSLIARAGLEPALATTELVHLGSQPSLLDRNAGRGPMIEIIGDLAESLLWVDTNVPCIPASELADSRPTEEEYLPEADLSTLSRPAHLLTYRGTMLSLSRLIPPAANVFIDAGNVGASAVHYLPAPRGGRVVVALGMGGMGYTFGAAIGSAMTTERPTYVIAGDGAFYMHGLEVHTAVEHELPITFIVLNNNAHAMCVAREQLYYHSETKVNRFRTAYLDAGIGAMFPGTDTIHVRTRVELAETIRGTRTQRGPRFIMAELSADELPPFLPFLEAASERPYSQEMNDGNRQQQAG